MSPSRARPSAQTVATFGFNVPCRRFMITSNIARDRRFPVVDEFVLRLLHLAERLPTARLATFFGFSKDETATVLSDLQTRGLVAFVGDDIELSPKAQKLFKGGRDGFPEIVQVETWVDRLWFDLISRNMLAPERTRSLGHLIDLKPPNAAAALPVAFAREAFQDNFPDFLRTIRRINNPEQFSLYSVSDVMPDRFGYVVVSGAMELELEPKPRLTPRLFTVDVQDFAKYRPLMEAMHAALGRLTEPETSVASLAEFRRLTGEPSFAPHQTPDGLLDLNSWLAARSKTRPPVVGASYLERNVATLARALDRHCRRRLGGRRPEVVPLTWFRPTGSSWGVSQDLGRVGPQLAGVLKRHLGGGWTPRSTLVGPASSRRETMAFGRLFDRGRLAPAGHLSAGTEVLYLHGLAAMVLTRAPLTSAISIPIGVVLSEEEDLQRLEGALRPSNQKGFENLWSKSEAADAVGV